MKMKTLDEVIKNFEICRKARLNIRSCDGCTYADDNNLVCISNNECDVLHYLKEYKGRVSDLNCAEDAIKRIGKNAPLTWDELKSMEGKPVWVEVEKDYRNEKYWAIVTVIDALKSGKEWVSLKPKDCFSKESYGTEWQAYRKER